MQPLFPGDSELQQLLHIFKLLGTPTETIWHGVTQFRDWHEYPVWHKQVSMFGCYGTGRTCHKDC